MKLRMTELREMVREALRRSLTEAKRKPKEILTQSEDSVVAQRDRHVRGTGYSHSPANDFSRPLGSANLYKSQGASPIGGFTGVGPQGPVTAEKILRKMREMQLRKVIRMVVGEQLTERAIDNPNDHDYSGAVVKPNDPRKMHPDRGVHGKSDTVDPQPSVRNKTGSWDHAALRKEGWRRGR